jgi:hypothetical protein
MPDHPTPPSSPSLDLVDILKNALLKALLTADLPSSPHLIAGSTSLAEMGGIVERTGLSIDRLLSEAALESYRAKRGKEKRAQRDGIEYFEADKRPEHALRFTDDPDVSWSLTTKTVLDTLKRTNRAIELIDDLAAGNDIPIFTFLGLRNLSSFVGEIFASELYGLQADRLLPNPNQDGYPDLLALTPQGRLYIEERERNGETSEKRYWSPFPYGGIEVKATCGNVLPASTRAKPKIGEARITSLVSAEWKAHHRDTNNLLGIYWDFIDEIPTVLAAFYRNDLTSDDWGRVVQPREGGGRTTSVSIMTRSGVKRMGEGWLLLPTLDVYRNVLSKGRVFSICDSAFTNACSARVSPL